MIEKSSNTAWLIAVICLIIALIVIGTNDSTVNIQSDGTVDNSIISVIGASELNVDPDMASITLTVQTKRDTATAAQADNKIFINKVIKALKDAGLQDKDIETSNYYLFPTREYDQQTRKYTDTGYTQTHSLKVTIDDVDETGAVIDAAVRAGVNNIGNIQFSLSDDLKADVESQALEAATKEARSKANALADSLNTKIIKIYRVSESNVFSTPYRYNGLELAAVRADSYEETTISPEDVKVTARINIEYVIEG